MIFIYTSREIADICGVSVQSVNKRIRNFTETEFETYVKLTETKSKFITEQGLLYFKSCYCDKMPLKEPTNDFDYTTVIETLTEQLKVKDAQIMALQEQVNTLLEQSKNFQVLLQGQQVLSLKEPKKSFIKRLFGRSSEQE